MGNLERSTALLLAAAAAWGQATNANASAEKKSFLKGIKVSGLMDSYYGLNFNHPASKENSLRNFDIKNKRYDLNYGRISFERSAEPFGFRVDAGLGTATKLLHGNERAWKGARYIQQAYLSYKIKQLHGAQVDFGKFNTSAGAEVTETHLNWNYSRSFLYANGPYYHFGLRTTVPVNKYFTAGWQLVNGWNNIRDNNSGKTMGFTGALTVGKLSWFNTYYTGPEKVDTTEGRRSFYDTIVAYNPTGKLNFLVNFDYGRDKRIGAGEDTFWGVATSLRYKVTERFYLSPRWEYYRDRDGFITGTPQALREFTGTAEFKLTGHMFTRVEFRRDWSSTPFFDRGNLRMNYPNQMTATVGLVAVYGGDH